MPELTISASARARRAEVRDRAAGAAASGKRSSRYSMIGSDCAMVRRVPSSSVISSVGTCAIGLRRAVRRVGVLLALDDVHGDVLVREAP